MAEADTIESGRVMLKRAAQKIKDFLESATSEYILSDGRTKEGFDTSVIPLQDPSCHLAEQYKMLCTKIFHASDDSDASQVKSLAVMSAQPSDGKTTTAVNLAVTLATAFKQKVVLIDSDLRRPRIHKFFSIDRGPGLVEILEGKQDYRAFLEKPVVNKLHVIPAGSGTDSPAMLLNSAGMKVLLSRLANKFDVILFDTPPVMRAADAQSVGLLTDYRLFVVKEGVTPRHMVEQAIASLSGTGAEPDACVLTNVRRAIDYYSYFTNASYREYYQETQSY